MIRLRLTPTGPWHSLDHAAPGAHVRLDCAEEIAYRALELTTESVAVADRCETCEAKRLAAIEFFVQGRVETINRWWE